MGWLVHEDGPPTAHNGTRQLGEAHGEAARGRISARQRKVQATIVETVLDGTAIGVAALRRGEGRPGQ